MISYNSLNKISGIYQIKNKINSKRYIGKSTNISSRWYYHLIYLLANKHENNEIQEEFNQYGVSAFDFTILEIIDGIEKLTEIEQKYIDTLDLNFDYNKCNAIRENINAVIDYDRFIDFINTKWLLPEDIDKYNIKQLHKYKIHTDKEKQEIIDLFIECNLLNLYPYQITFNKIFLYMQNYLGYTILSKRGGINGIKYTYKIILDFDKEKINLDN